MASDRDPRSDLGAWLGEELRRARIAAGFKSQDQLARRLGFERTVITKIETGGRPPSDDVAAALVTLFPGLAGGRFAELAAVARRAAGKFPGPDPEGGERDMAHISGLGWRTSSYSGGNGGACVEVAAHDGMILVRDTKDHGRGLVYKYTPDQWRAFVAGVRNGESGLDEPRRLPQEGRDSSRETPHGAAL